MVSGLVLPLCPLLQQQATRRGRRHLWDLLPILLVPSSEAHLPLIPYKAPTPGKGSHERGPAGYRGALAHPHPHVPKEHAIFGGSSPIGCCAAPRGHTKFPLGFPGRGKEGEGILVELGLGRGVKQIALGR